MRAQSGETIMSLDLHLASAAGEVAAASQPNLIARAAAWIRSYRQHRRQMRELQAMDAHMLADLGITRSQVEYLAQQPYAGDWSAVLFPPRRG
jgi:uncharacterized protein YjiS (DUF1127 family)